MTNKKHNYDWDEMEFDPDKDRPSWAFIWNETPQGDSWWANNAHTELGEYEFARMKRLYAEDMAAKEGPVRTVTRKEIVPGVYGRIAVGGYEGGVVPIGILDDSGEYNFTSFMTPAELRAAAETLIQIADALEENE